MRFKFFCFAEDVAKDGAKVKQARKLDIHIVSPKFIEDVKNGMVAVLAVKENLICTWGGDVSY